MSRRRRAKNVIADPTYDSRIPSNHGMIVENNKIQKFEQAKTKTLSRG
jgi:hypothetical protein